MEDEKSVNSTIEENDKSEYGIRYEKPKAARYAEGIFCIVYLLFMIIVTYIGYRKYDRIADDQMLLRVSLRFGFAYMMGILLIIGDGFHLIPRIIIAFRGSMWKQHIFLGMGNLISSITITFFYNLILMLGDSVEFKETEYNYDIEKAILILTIIRFFVLLLPMNKWYTEEGSRKWAKIRNSFFVLIGILTIIGLAQVSANCYTMPVHFYLIIIILIILSFGFYLPVAIDGKKNPKLGMLMIPKTLCYMAMMGLIVFWPY